MRLSPCSLLAPQGSRVYQMLGIGWALLPSCPAERCWDLQASALGLLMVLQNRTGPAPPWGSSQPSSSHSASFLIDIIQHFIES